MHRPEPIDTEAQRVLAELVRVEGAQAVATRFGLTPWVLRRAALGEPLSRSSRVALKLQLERVAA